jgi:hypothetical protein
MGSDLNSSRSPGLDAAWRAYQDVLKTLRRRMLASSLAADPADRARAQYWLMQAQAASFNLVIGPRQSRPTFFVNTVFEPNLYTWLLPNADFLYRYAFLDGAGRFRIRGKRGSSHFLEAQTISGFWGDPNLRLLATYDFDKFEPSGDGAFEIAVGPEPAPDCPNWIATDPASANNTMIIREAFYDWSSEQRSELSIEAVDPGSPPIELDEAALIARLEAASRMMEFCFRTFSGGLTEDVLKAVGTNRFLLVDTSKDEHASNPSAGYVPAVYELRADEALIVEVDVPEARYWNIHLGDVWWQVTDYTNRQSSLNGCQAVADSDGIIRIVISPRDPGIANWLDTGGNPKGVALLRWYFTRSYPTPAARRVPFDRVLAELPARTARVTAEARSRALAERRQAIRRRYGQ